MDALLSREPLRGTWYDRTKEWAAWQRKEKRTYPEAVELHLWPLPCWAHLPDAEMRSRVAGMVADIEEEAEAERIKERRVPKSPKQILDLTKISRRRRPQNFKPSPAPLVHPKKLFKDFYFAYSEIKRAYRAGAEKLASGDLSVEFPEGTYPPALHVLLDVGKRQTPVYHHHRLPAAASPALQIASDNVYRKVFQETCVSIA